MTQRATLPMTLALVIVSLGFATLIFVQRRNLPHLDEHRHWDHQRLVCGLDHMLARLMIRVAAVERCV